MVDFDGDGTYNVWEIDQEKKSKREITDYSKKNYWRILWVSNSNIAESIYFDSTQLLLNNVVNSDGFKVFDREDVKKIVTVEDKEGKFVNSNLHVVDVQIIEN